jgi:hypothetical protein
MTYIILHELLCVVLFLSVFCRLLRTDHRVKLDVRFAFVCLGVASVFGMIAPLAWAHRPDAYSLILLGSIVTTQLITSRHWRHGVPENFIHPEHRHHNRRHTDRRHADRREHHDEVAT